MAENPVPVCATADVPPGSVKSFDIDGTLVAVYNIDGTFYATDAVCTHAFADLADGTLDGDVITCAQSADARYPDPAGIADRRRQSLGGQSL